jgi:hypothetical protein
MVVNFINNSWEFTLWLWGHLKNNIISVAMANWVNIVFDSFGLLDKVIAYVKDKGSNLSTLITINKHCFLFTILVTMSIWRVLFWSCYVKGILVCHRWCQNLPWFYGGEFERCSKFLKKTITWINKYGKGRQEWYDFYVIVGLFVRMVKIHMKI